MVRLFAPCQGVIHRRIFRLLFPADIMQQARPDHHVNIRVLFRPGNRQPVIQHPVHMLLIMGAVSHTVQHIIFQYFKNRKENLHPQIIGINITTNGKSKNPAAMGMIPIHYLQN